MITFRHLINAFQKLELDRTQPVIVHASLGALGRNSSEESHPRNITGGAETVLGALLACFDHVIVPTFTYKTMLIPETGPENNGLTYGNGKDTNRMAEFFTPDLPTDKMIGIIPETLRRHPKAQRSNHPILSFAAINADEVLSAQSLHEPLGPIHILHADHGNVLLLGVDHTVNTSIHYAERLVGSKEFTRWALTPEGVVECPGFPGCSNGFNVLEAPLQNITRQVPVGEAMIRAIPLRDLVQTVMNTLTFNPLTLLCKQSDCERCNAVRAEHTSGGTQVT